MGRGVEGSQGKEQEERREGKWWEVCKIKEKVIKNLPNEDTCSDVFHLSCDKNAAIHCRYLFSHSHHTKKEFLGPDPRKRYYKDWQIDHLL